MAAKDGFSSSSSNQSNHVRVGLIYKTHGIRGEVLVLPLTSDPRRFERLSEVHLEDKDGLPFSLPKTAGKVQRMSGTFTVDYVKYHKEKILLKLQGVEDADAASCLSGQYLAVTTDQLIPLAPDTFFVFDLIGCLVHQQSDGNCIGEVTDVLETGSNDIYVVRDSQTGKEVLIPALKAVVKEVRTSEKRIVVDWQETL